MRFLLPLPKADSFSSSRAQFKMPLLQRDPPGLPKLNEAFPFVLSQSILFLALKTMVILGNHL
jgi:hypothetical protein